MLPAACLYTALMQASSLSSDTLYARLADSAENLPSPPWPLLSETQASFVFDLADGSVLKAVRKNGGLSSGDARLRREAAMLRALDGLGASSVRAPRLLAMGECSGSLFLDVPLAGWLRLEKLAGRAYSFDSFSMLASERRERMGEKLGAAIADLHQAAEPKLEAIAKLGDPIARQLTLAARSLSSPQDYPKLKRLEALWAEGDNPKTVLHGNLTLENVLWGEGDALAMTGWSEAGAGLAVSDLAPFELYGPLRDAVFRGYTARAGARPDMLRYRQAAASRAFMILALEGDQGHPREGMRRRRMLEEYLFQAGIE